MLHALSRLKLIVIKYLQPSAWARWLGLQVLANKDGNWAQGALFTDNHSLCHL